MTKSVKRDIGRNTRFFAVQFNNFLFPTLLKYLRHLTFKQHAKVVGLVGKRCMVNCQFNGKPAKALWDTGSQVSVISEVFVRQNFPEVQIRDILELLQTDLKLTAANGSDIPYHRWDEINFQVTPCSPVLTVPFLVRQETSDPPLIGYNTIEESIHLDPTTANPETPGETKEDEKGPPR